MSQKDIELMAHLVRRAGFGAGRPELELYLAKGYEATVEALLHPGEDHLDEDIVRRYCIDIDDLRQPDSIIGWWIYRNINSQSPLREKMALFFHGFVLSHLPHSSFPLEPFPFQSVPSFSLWP